MVMRFSAPDLSMQTSGLDKRLQQGSLIEMQRGFLGLVTVGDQATHQVDHEAHLAAVTGVLDLRDVFELVGNGFQDSPLA